MFSRCFRLLAPRNPDRMQIYSKRMEKSHVKPELLRKDRKARRKAIRIGEIVATTAALKLQLSNTTNARDLAISQLANNVFSAGHQFLCSSTNVSFVPNGNPAMPEVAIIGREHVGKTALLRSLFKSLRAVGKSNTPQRKQAINYFSVGDVFHIADVPGYGGTRVPWSAVLRHASLIRNFSRTRPNLKMLYYCMDVHFREGLRIHDIDLLKFMVQEVPNFTIVITKGDQLSTHDVAASAKVIKEELLMHDITHPVMVTSAYHMTGIDTLRYDMVMNAVHSLPTERLTLTEARKLGQRLLSQAEIGTVRQLSLPPKAEDDELDEWNEQVEAEGSAHLALDHGETHSSLAASSSTIADETDQLVLTSASAVEAKKKSRHEAPDAYQSLSKKLSNEGLMKYVHETSPWRNPLKWPSHVVPTKHPKSNIMKVPEDPHNPYLFQPQFVAPRMDMYFRRPNFGYRSAKRKGQYEPDHPSIFSKRYTVPYFPDVVDVALSPLPWTFVGSVEAYYEKSRGRELGLRLSNQAVREHINPLSDNPAPRHMPLLAAEIKKLEQVRYGGPIAHLKPRNYTKPLELVGAGVLRSPSPPLIEDTQAGVDSPISDEMLHPPL